MFYGVVLAVTCLLLLTFIPLDADNPTVGKGAAVASFIAIFWVFEVLPISVTALFPVALFPMYGVMSAGDVASAYFKDTTWVFVGGIFVAIAMQRWDLHTRIALKVVISSRGNPRMLLFGVMATTWFLSMWISNTSAVVCMLPNLLSIISRLEASIGKAKCEKFSKALLLGTAYSASIGGMATLIGTPPNLVLTLIFSESFDNVDGVLTFSKWLMFGFPLSLVFVLVLYVMFSYFYVKDIKKLVVPVDQLKAEYQRLGPLSYEERIILGVFVALAAMWTTRSDLELGAVTIPGWTRFFPTPAYIKDGTVAMIVSLLLFVIPSKHKMIVTNTTGSTSSGRSPLNNDMPVLSVGTESEASMEIEVVDGVDGVDGASTDAKLEDEVETETEGESEGEGEKDMTNADGSVTVYAKKMLLDWEYAEAKVPFGLLLLFGGGFALASGIEVSGLSEFLGEKLTALSGINRFVLVMCISTFTSLFTDVTSNSASSNILLVILAAMSIGADIHPLAIMIPGALACSAAFVLPVATPPNLIVFSANVLELGDMIVMGLWCTVVGVILIGFSCAYWAPIVFGFDFLDHVPTDCSFRHTPDSEMLPNTAVPAGQIFPNAGGAPTSTMSDEQMRAIIQQQNMQMQQMQQMAQMQQMQ
ncbi:sodium/sulphate symporter, partial [Kipferlia bialata]|eukprot:g7789.t1